jgi:hypothetical protein
MLASLLYSIVRLLVDLLSIRDRGLHKLKGVPERWRTYAASLPRPDVETPLP